MYVPPGGSTTGGLWSPPDTVREVVVVETEQNEVRGCHVSDDFHGYRIQHQQETWELHIQDEKTMRQSL